MAEPTQAQISARAHAIYLRRGSQPGRALDDWLQAERELRAESAKTSSWPATAAGAPRTASSFAPPPSPVPPHAPLPPRPAPSATGSFAPPVPPAKQPPAPTKPAANPPPKPSSPPKGNGGGGGNKNRR